ncbi:carbohydrate kinase family protein [Candidatus Bathyarchaeota archaeon]|nr:carbohydrate kinase family protein [Candidatus Bathyarchaeota archaeon]
MISFDAIGFGALNVDKLFKVHRIANAEEESFITDCIEASGGSAANTIVGLARLKCKVGFIGKVSSDREGKMLLEDLKRENVDTNGIVYVKHGRSGAVMGFVDEKGERALYIDSGVNDTLSFDEVGVDYACRTGFLHLTSFVGDKPFQAQKKLLTYLPEKVKVSFDPGMCYARMGYAKLQPLIEKSFVVMPNLSELALITGKTDYREGATFLLQKGVAIVAVKLGAKGCYVTDGRESHLIEPFEVKVVDTTGAGDAFCAGFLYGLINNKGLFESGRIGNFVASRCIMKMGARAGLPILADLEKEGL